MKLEDILYGLFQTAQITLEDYLKFQELPSVTINRIREYIKNQTDAVMYDETKVGESTNIGLNTGI